MAAPSLVSAPVAHTSAETSEENGAWALARTNPKPTRTIQIFDAIASRRLDSSDFALILAMGSAGQHEDV